MKNLSFPPKTTWASYNNDQTFPFPTIKIKPECNPHTMSIASVGAWLILPVIGQEDCPFGGRKILGWTCVQPEEKKGANSWKSRYRAPGYFASKKQAKSWAEQYRLFPLDLLAPFLTDPREAIMEDSAL